ncbi:YdbC family protein [Brevibacillus fortis]|uniref:YdbC family protein n=1 Tax=Brevibacillus fortis TaxID=2126352 RepID=UPI002E1ED49B|nr:YdbC family protein [Brevibacillus fortis]
MLIKWITCKVTESQKQTFSLAQEKWRPLEGIEGFLGQIGGWNQDQPLEACILAFWEDIHHYQAFMEKYHDPIFHQSGQCQTYEAISVKLFSKIVDMDERNILDVLENGEILRVVCAKDGMSATEAMLGGVVAQSQKNSIEYLSASLWKKDCSQVNENEQPPDYSVILEPAWRVVKKGGAK